MPKIVDADERRRAVAEAVFSVVSRDGLESASLRNIADEAGLAIGSVRHYFGDHSELLLFAMKEMAGRIERRVRSHVERILASESGADRKSGTEKLLGEFLPLDEERRKEATVWLAFATASRTRPELRPRAREVLDGMREVMAHVLRAGQRTGGLPDSLDVQLESIRLAALLDGLTLQAVQSPEVLPPRLLRRVLRRHLTALAAGS